MLSAGWTVLLLFTQAYGWSDCFSELFTVYADFRFDCISKEDCLQKNLVIYERTCLHKCPGSAGYFKSDTRECFSECPVDSVINGTICLRPNYCSEQGKVVFERKCVDGCPDHNKFNHDHVCYDVCPGDTVGKESHCIPRSECVSDSKVLDGTCVEVCPVDYLLTEDDECVAACPPGTVGEANLCISEEECIKSKRRVIFNNSCVESCPSESPLLDEGFCTQQCSVGKFKNGSICTLESVCIEQGNFVFNSTCRTSCPDIAPISSSGLCVSECTNDFVANNGVCLFIPQCIAQYKVIFDGKCINSCPETMPFIFRGSCISKCPETTLIRLNQCIFKDYCIQTRRFQYGNMCVNVCPQEANYRMFYVSLGTYSICVTTCPVETVRNETGGKCLSKTSCFKDNVDAVVFNNSCADFCPSSRKYNYSSVCYDECPENTYAVGVQCLPSYRCTSAYQVSTRRVFHQGSCLKRCPPYARYEHNKTCFSVCPKTTKQLNTFCSVFNCTSNKVYDGDNCITLSTCQDEGKMAYEGECLRYCPYDYFRYSSSCRKLPHMWLSFGITGLMCLLCIIPIVLVLYSPKKIRLCGCRFKKTDGQKRVQGEYQLVRMVSRAEEVNIPVDI